MISNAHGVVALVHRLIHSRFAQGDTGTHLFDVEVMPSGIYLDFSFLATETIPISR